VAYIGNTPSSTTVIQVEARKSLSLSLWFMDANRRPADLTGCTVRMVAKQPPFRADDTTDADNLIDSSVAEFPSPELGYARFELQALELDLAPGEYPFVIVLVSPAGYSTAAVKGVLDVQPNPEFSAMADVYDDVASPASLEVRLRNQATIEVLCGPLIPPGFTWMSDADKAKVDGLSLAGNLLPAGGDTRWVLAKASPDDYDFTWREPQAFDGTLDATGVPAGRAPLSDGTGFWAWTEVSTVVDWDIPEGEPNSVINKPVLGTASTRDDAFFAAAEHTHELTDLTNVGANELPAAWLPRLTELDGVTSGTADPVGGDPGDVYLKYLP
jgi:hypothetical protein